MNISINGNKTDVPENALLIAVLEMQNIANAKGVAIAVNNTVIQRQEWSSLALKENDNLLIIKATQGG